MHILIARTEWRSRQTRTRSLPTCSLRGLRMLHRGRDSDLDRDDVDATADGRKRIRRKGTLVVDQPRLTKTTPRARPQPHAHLVGVLERSGGGHRFGPWELPSVPWGARRADPAPQTSKTTLEGELPRIRGCLRPTHAQRRDGGKTGMPRVASFLLEIGRYHKREIRFRLQIVPFISPRDANMPLLIFSPRPLCTAGRSKFG